MKTTAKERQRIINAVKGRVLKNHFNVGGVSYEEFITFLDSHTPERF